MSLLRGIAIGLATAAGAGIAIGYLGFAAEIGRAAPPDPLPQADAIVALTGGGPARLATGMRLLSEGRGRRLLVTGVNPIVSDAELAKVLDAPEPLFACCVDVGRFAEDTLGNAAETAGWAERNGFDALIVITDDYHMPRALVELRIAMPDTTLIAYPVHTAIGGGAWREDADAALTLAGEFIKLMAIRARESVLAADRVRAEDPAGAGV